jgi:hypothetical protein
MNWSAQNMESYITFSIPQGNFLRAVFVYLQSLWFAAI